MKMNKWYFRILFLATTLFITSCNNTNEPELPKGDYENGILISGEGSSAGTGSVSFISNDLTSEENLIYKKVNNLELGIYLQSIAFDDDNAFIVVDNQNTITQVDRYTFEKIGEISTGLETPRYMAVVGNKGYVTNWGNTSPFVAVIDLTIGLVEETITISSGPERIVYGNGKLFVSHKGGWGSNNVISVIDPTSKNVTEITVKDKPDEMFFNNSQQLVVLSEGAVQYDANWNVTGNTIGSIITINTSTNAIVNELDFAEGDHPSLMVINNSTIYYALNGKVYSINESATSLASNSLLESQGYLYGLEVKDNNIYMIDASFTDVSTLNVYNATTKAVISSKSVALGASKIYFN